MIASKMLFLFDSRTILSKNLNIVIKYQNAFIGSFQLYKLLSLFQNPKQ